MQEPKYFFEDGKVFNRASGEQIPEDEPVIVFRARDNHALDVLRFYLSVISNAEHAIAVGKRIDDFAAFKAAHPDRMKEPDTQISLDFG